MRGILPDASDIALIRPGNRPWLRVEAYGCVIEYSDPRGCQKHPPGFLRRNGAGKFHMHCLTVTDKYRCPDARCRNRHFRSTHYFSGFFQDFPLFSGITAVQKYIYFRQQIKSNLMRENLGYGRLPVEYLFRLGGLLFNCRYIAPGDRLIGIDNDAFNGIKLVQRI